MDELVKDDGQDLKEQTIQALQSEIQEKARVIQQQESENQRLTRRLANAETELAQLKGGLTFRMLGRYLYMVDRLLPLESRRRHLYNRARRLAHVLLLDGPRSLYHTIRNPRGTHQAAVEDVIVYQMAKVGSSSVVASLKYTYAQLGLPVKVYHTHSLNHLDEIEANAMTRPNPEVQLPTMQGNRALRKLIDQNQRKTWKLISLVRDPVARNVAWFFHKLDLLVPDWREKWKQDSLSLEQLQELFLDRNQVDHKSPETWFDNEMLAVFSIDVFAEPFPTSLGYKIYEGSPRASLLLIRLENLSACAPKAMKEFLALDDFLLISSNMGDDKAYAEVYRTFRRLPLPRTYVEEIYSTRLARHFYSEQEIEKFTGVWTAAKSS
jgi:hypothetical protein